MGEVYRVVVQGTWWERKVIDLCNTEEQFKAMTLLQLKKKIAERLPRNPEVGRLQLSLVDTLLYTNNQLLDGDDRLLSHFGIQHLSLIHVDIQKDAQQLAHKKTDSAEMGKVYRVVAQVLKEDMVIDLCNTEEQFRTMTVLQLKEKIAERSPYNPEEGMLRLIFMGKMLGGDDQLLSDFGVQHMSKIHVVLRFLGGGSYEDWLAMEGLAGKRRSSKEQLFSFEEPQ